MDWLKQPEKCDNIQNESRSQKREVWIDMEARERALSSEFQRLRFCIRGGYIDWFEV